MNPLLLVALSIAAMSPTDDGLLSAATVDNTRTAEPRGPGYRHSYSVAPLPKPASQAKRRRKARRTRGGGR